MKRTVSAGDLEKYAYCPLSWWLSREEDSGHSEEEFRGMERHAEIERNIEGIALKEKESRKLEKFIFWFSLVATSISLLGLIVWPLPSSIHISEILLVEALLWLVFSLYFLREFERKRGKEGRDIYEKLIFGSSIASTMVAVYAVVGFALPEDIWISRIMQVLALVWLMGASLFLRRSAELEVEARKVRRKMNVPDGEIVYVDLDNGKSELMISEKYGLTGRPDHIIKKEGMWIPVELKTGRTPRGPLFSHIVQVGTYCTIIEDITGKRPPYGIIKYPEKSFEIEYTDELRDIVLKKRDELLRDLDRGEAHRNHRKPGKCRHCSRRERCPERLA